MVVQAAKPASVQPKTVQSRIDALGAFSHAMSKDVRVKLTGEIQDKAGSAGLIKSLTARVDQLYADSARLAKARAKVQKSQSRMPAGTLQAELSRLGEMARAVHDDAGNLQQLIGALGIADQTLAPMLDAMNVGRALI